MTISSKKRNDVLADIKSLKMDRFAEQSCIDAFEAALLADDANKINVADTVCDFLRENFSGDAVMAAENRLIIANNDIDILRTNIIKDLE